MYLLSGMQLFARVVETGGFTAVARENNTSAVEFAKVPLLSIAA